MHRNNRNFFLKLTLFFWVFTATWVSQTQAAPFAYIPNYVGDNITVIDIATNTVSTTITGEYLNDPYGIAVNPAGTKAYVTNSGGNTVSVIDTTSNAETHFVTVGTTPYGIAINPAGTKVYVANYGSHSISVIDTETNLVTGTVTVGNSPVGIAVHPAGTKIYVGNYSGDTVSVIDATTLAVTPVTAGNMPRGIAINSAGTKVYVANGSSGNVSVINTADNTVSTITLSGSPGGVAINSAGSRLYVSDHSTPGHVWIINAAAPYDVIETVTVGAHPYGMSMNSNDTRVYVANVNSDTVSVIDTASNSVVDTVNVGDGPYALGKFIKPRMCFPPPANMTSWWGGDNNALDMVGTNHGTLVNGATYTAGKVNQAFSLDGTDDYVNVAHDASLSFAPSAPMSFETWVYRTSTLHTQHIFAKRTGCAAFNYQLALDTNGGTGLLFGGSNFTITTTGGTSDLPLNTWTHIAGTSDGTTLKLFINGQLAASGTGTLGPENSDPLKLGAAGICGVYTFGGLIDETTIYHRALSAEEIAASYNAGSAGTCDTTPEAFAFSDQTDINITTATQSNLITVSGINNDSDISISSCNGTNCLYRINNEAWTSTAGKVNNGDSVTVKQTSSSNYATTTDLTLNIGGVTDTFSVTTGRKYMVTPSITGNGTVTSNTTSIDCIARPEPGLNDGTDNGTKQSGKDAFGGSSSEAGYNDGGISATIVVTPTSYCNDTKINGFIQFDVTSLPSTVEHVYLGFTHHPHDTYCYSNCNANFYFYPLTSVWQENTVSPSNHPTASPTPAYGPINVTFPNDFGTREYEITDLYQQWKSGSLANYGIEISSPTVGCNNAAVMFNVHSSDSEISKRPYLRIVTATSQNNECTGGNSWNYLSGTTITLTATPEDGSTFSSWTGDCSGTGTTVDIPMDGDKTCTATFTPNIYTVTSSKTGNGIISPETTQSFNHNDTTTFTVTPDSGYSVSMSGTCGGALVGTTYTTAPVTADCTVIATFTRPALTITKTGNGTGTVTSAPAGIACGAICAAEFDFGTDVTLTALPAKGSVFKGWTGDDCTGTGDCTVTMDAQKEISAAFEKDFPWPMFLPAITKGKE